MIRKRIAIAMLLTACAAGIFGAQAAERTDRRKTPAPVIDLKPAASPEQMLELLTQIEALQNEVRALRNRVEVQEHELDKLEARQRDVSSDFDRRLQTLERRGASEQAVPAAPAASGPATGEGEQQEYDAAFALLKQAQYERAAKSFQAFLAKHPKGPLSDNAQYWLAESHFVLHDLKAALDEFNVLLHSYPTSPKVPDALLKLGYAHQELGQLDKARQTLEQLVRKYPNTHAAQLGEKRLKELPRDNGEADAPRNENPKKENNRAAKKETAKKETAKKDNSKK